VKQFEVSLLDSTTGAKIRLYSMKASSKPKGVIVVAHGMAEHGGRYERFANHLVTNGYHTLCYDHRGHGETVAYGAPQGMFTQQDGLQKVVEDMGVVVTHAHEENPKLPIILFGHSMGAIIGLNYCIKHSDKIDAAALWNAGVDGGALLVVYNLLLKVERMLRGSDTSSFIANKLAFEDWNKKFAPNRTPFDWLSRDEAEVDKYIADPMCGFMASNGLWLEIVKAIKIGANDNELTKIRNDLPIHLSAGGKDPCSDYGKAVERVHTRLKKTGIQDLALTIDPDNRHEALNELNRDNTMTEFVTWLDERFA